MDQNQPTASPAPVYSVPPRSMLSTGTPTIISFAVVILLFILPFSELRCGSTALASKSGIGFAIGSDWKPAGGLGKDSMGEMTTKTTGKKEGHAQYFAIGALALALIGLLLSFAKARGGHQAGILIGILGAGALIGLMFEVKKWFNSEMAKEAADKTKDATDSMGLDKLNASFTVAFTPWFYIAVVAFLAAAFFSYSRTRNLR